MAFEAKIEPPTKLVLENGREEDCRRFKSQWKTFTVLTELDKKETAYQHAFFKYCVGPEGTKVIEAASEYKDGETTPDDMMKILEQYCIGDRNLIHERFLFNSLQQQPTETFDSFYSKLRTHVKRCQYDNMTDELIRDRIVLGIHCNDTRKKLIASGNTLTLNNTLKLCHSQEVAISAMKEFTNLTVTEPLSKTVAAVSKARSKPGPYYPNRPSNCHWCGKEPHPRDKCPAKNSDCNSCRKKGHFASVCRSKPTTTGRMLTHEVTTEQETDTNTTCIFTGELTIDSLTTTEEWTVALEINSHTLTCKLDSGADATILSSTEPLLNDVSLRTTTAELVGPGNQNIPCLGCFEADMKYKDKRWTETVYVVKQQPRNLLSRTACTKVGTTDLHDRQCHTHYY